MIVCGIYVWAFGFQTALTVIARYQYRGIPGAAKTPVSLSDLSVSSVPHQKVSYFGYEFEIPWDDVDEQKSRTVGTIHVTAFQSGNAFWFSTFPPREFVKSVVEIAKVTPEQFRQIYGDEVFGSDYGFMCEMLQITPRDFSPFMSRGRAAASIELLLVKATSIPEAGSGILSIHIGDRQGFQFGNPLSRPPEIRDDLYSDDSGVELLFFQHGGTSTGLSQGEINRVLQSVHKVPAPSLASNLNSDK